MLYEWKLKCIESFGANQSLLVLLISDCPESGRSRSYFCVNTPQAEDILRVFREATGILPASSDVTGQTRFVRESSKPNSFIDYEMCC